MQTRMMLAGGVLALVLACAGLGAGGEAPATDGSGADGSDPDRANLSEDPYSGRAGHAGVVLPTGRVLFAGGNGAAAAAEYFDPKSSAWVPVDSLSQARFGHAMAGLADGRVLLIGGEDPAAADPNADPTGMRHAEIFDPSTGAFAPVARSLGGFLAPKAARLPDGQVLVVNCELGEVRAERYDPAADAWSEAPAPERCAGDDDLVAIAGGVLIGSGGAAYELERFDAARGTWTRTAPAPRKRTSRLAVLPDGRVLATGRRSAAADEPDAAVFDPGSDTWMATPDIPRAYDTIDHADFALVAAGDRVWRIGGSAGRPPVSSAQVEVWDAKANTWTAAESLREPRSHAAATALPDGRVLVYGGRGKRGGPPLASAEILRP